MRIDSDLGLWRHGVVHGELPGPAPGDGVEHLAVPVVEAADVRLHADLAVRVRQQALDGDQHLGDRQACNTISTFKIQVLIKCDVTICNQM